MWFKITQIKLISRFYKRKTEKVFCEHLKKKKIIKITRELPSNEIKLNKHNFDEIYVNLSIKLNILWVTQLFPPSVNYYNNILVCVCVIQKPNCIWRAVDINTQKHFTRFNWRIHLNFKYTDETRYTNVFDLNWSRWVIKGKFI